MSFSFVCNICSAENRGLRLKDLDREAGRCEGCGSLVRLRSLIHLLSLHLFGEALAIGQWPENHEILGYGISDWPKFSKYLGPKITYTNTQFDLDVAAAATVLDITKPPRAWFKTADFVICTEVLEHVVPPAQAAFDGLLALLKPGGRLIFSVPYRFKPTIEHFPDLHEWSIQTDEAGSRTVINTARNGDVQTFDNIRFHGGGKQVLEMRVFGLADLKASLRAAGFVNIQIAGLLYKPFGIRFAHNWSLPMAARRPLRARASR
jgi:SAM-dependent methyltransferase